LLLENFKNFTDTSSVSENIPLLTFFQRTQGNRTMASHLDYIFIDEDHSHLAAKLNTLYGNSDHKLVKCVFNFQQATSGPTIWKFDKRTLTNTLLEKDLREELQEAVNSNDWDFTKIQLQSIIRAYKKPKATENNIMKLNRKITDLNKKLANNSSNNSLQAQADNLTYQLQKELTDMAEK